MKKAKFQAELKKSLSEVSGDFTSQVFANIARANGVTDEYIEAGGIARFLQNSYLVKRISAMRWYKKENAQPSKPVQAELPIHRSVISLSSVLTKISDEKLIEEIQRRGFIVFTN